MCVSLLLRTISQYRPDLLNGEIIDTWMTATFSLAGSHLMLSVRSLAAERQRMVIATPMLSAGVPEFERSLQFPSKTTNSSDLFELSPIESSPISPPTPSTASNYLHPLKYNHSRSLSPAPTFSDDSPCNRRYSSDDRAIQPPPSRSSTTEQRCCATPSSSFAQSSQATRPLTVQTTFPRLHRRPPHELNVNVDVGGRSPPLDVSIPPHHEGTESGEETILEGVPVLRRIPCRDSGADEEDLSSSSQQHHKIDEDPSQSHPPISAASSPALLPPPITSTSRCIKRSALSILCMGQDRKWLDDWAAV